MEVVGAQENPSFGAIGEDVIGLGGGVIGSVAGIEVLNNELVARAVPKVAVVLLDLVLSGFSFAWAASQNGLVRKLAMGFGAGAAAETISTAIEVVQGV